MAGMSMNYARPAAVKLAFKLHGGAVNPRATAGLMSLEYGVQIAPVAAVWIKTLSILNALFFEPSSLFAAYNAYAQIIAGIAARLGHGGSSLVEGQATKDRFDALALNPVATLVIGNHGPGGLAGLV